MNDRRSPDAPALVCVEASTQRLHLACAHRGRVQTLDLDGGAQASRTLLPSLNQLLAGAHLAWSEVDAVAFGQGPGAFTGLRTACAVAQGLALGAGCEVLALDTLMVVAQAAYTQLLQAGGHTPDSLDGACFWVLQDARMDELYVAAYRRQGGRWLSVHAAQLWSLDEPDRRWPALKEGSHGSDGEPASWWCGNALSLTRLRQDELGAAPAGRGRWRSRWLQAAPDGAAMAELARAAWEEGACVDAALALPVYVRNQVAQTLAERAQAASGHSR